MVEKLRENIVMTGCTCCSEELNLLTIVKIGGNKKK